eukprot:90871-Hanusia_phi.AAC.1
MARLDQYSVHQDCSVDGSSARFDTAAWGRAAQLRTWNLERGSRILNHVTESARVAGSPGPRHH